MFDQMVANMLGIKPEEMQEMLSGMQTLLKDGVKQLGEINEKCDRILAHLEPEGKTDGD